MKHFEEILCSLGAVNNTILSETNYWTLWQAEYRTPVSVVKGNYLYLKSKCPLLEANATNLSNFKAKCGADGYHVVVTPKSDLAKDLKNTVAKFRGQSGYTTQTLLNEHLLSKVKYRSLQKEDYFVPPSISVAGVNTAKDAMSFLTDWLTGAVSTPKNTPVGILCADGGIGKTTLARELCEAVRLKHPKVLPLLIEADQWKSIANTGFTLDTLWDIAISRRLENSNSLRANPSALRVLMQEGLLVVIFDGFDELAAISNDHNRPQEIISELKELFTPEDEEISARVILTSRSTYWKAIQANIPDLNVVEEFRLIGFDNDQRKQYFQKRLTTPTQRDIALRLAKEISGALYPADAVNVELLNEDRISGTPFILSLIAHVIEGEDGDRIEPYSIDPLEPLLRGVCKREIIRQDLNISIDKQLVIFEEIFRAYDDISLADLDFILQLYEISDHGERERFANHFLLQRTRPDSFKARFEVLRVYFVARFLAKGLQKLYEGSHAKEIALALSQNSIGQSQVSEWLASQLRRLEHPQLQAAIRHAYEIIGLPENFANRHRASIALSHLISQLLPEAEKIERTNAMFNLLGGSNANNNALARSITLAGKLKSFDFSNIIFENCIFVDVNFSNCKFDDATRFSNCKFEGTLEFYNCEGAALSTFTNCNLSEDSELVLSELQKRPANLLVRQSFAEDSLSRALKKFKGDTGFHSIQVRRCQSGFNPKNPYNNDVWKMLKRQKIIAEHTISGVSEGGYNIVEDKDIRREVIQYIDNGIVGQKLKVIIAALIG